MIPKNNARNLKENIQLKLIAHLKIKATKKITSINSMGPKNKHHPIPSTDSMDHTDSVTWTKCTCASSEIPTSRSSHVGIYQLDTVLSGHSIAQHSCEKWWVTQGFPTPKCGRVCPWQCSYRKKKQIFHRKGLGNKKSLEPLKYMSTTVVP